MEKPAENSDRFASKEDLVSLFKIARELALMKIGHVTFGDGVEAGLTVKGNLQIVRPGFGISLTEEMGCVDRSFHSSGSTSAHWYVINREGVVLGKQTGFDSWEEGTNRPSTYSHRESVITSEPPEKDFILQLSNALSGLLAQKRKIGGIHALIARSRVALGL